MNSQVFRCYVYKRPGFDVEAQGLCRDLREQLGIENLSRLTILNRYDMQGIAAATYEQAKRTVFSEPQVDDVFDEDFPRPAAATGPSSPTPRCICWRGSCLCPIRTQSRAISSTQWSAGRRPWTSRTLWNAAMPLLTGWRRWTASPP